MADRSNARSVVKKITITALVGVLSFPLTDLLFGSLPAQIAMAAGFGSVVLLIQFLVDFEKRLGKVEAEQVKSVADIRSVVYDGFAKVNDATRLFAQVEAAGVQPPAVTTLVRHAAGISPDAHPLVCAFAQQEIDRVSRFLRELTDEHADCEGEDKDWLLELTGCASESIDAISLPEVDAAGATFHNFWQSELGRRYMEVQRKAVLRGVQVRRVFVTEQDSMANDVTLQRICAMQAALGIEVRVLNPSAFPRAVRGSLFDFILFDNTLSYEVTTAAHVEKGESPMILSTHLQLRKDKVRARMEQYRNIWSLATPWSEDPARQTPPVPHGQPGPEG